MSLNEAVKEGLWLRGMMEEFGFKQKCVKVWCD